MPELKLGKQPAAPQKSDFKLKSYAVSLPPLPKKPFGYGTIYSDWGYLGNDRYGDCVWAGADHETMLWNKLAGRSVQFATANTLSDYSSTGFDPVTGANDNGTNVHQSMSYRRSTGVVDSSGIRHKIDAYVSIAPRDWNLMLRCVWTFGAVGIGFEVPGSIWNDGQTWHTTSDKNIIGGHYVPIVGTRNPATEATCISWGHRYFMTKEFYETFNDEAWIPLSREQLRSSGFNSRHIDWISLNNDLASL